MIAFRWITYSANFSFSFEEIYLLQFFDPLVAYEIMMKYTKRDYYEVLLKHDVCVETVVRMLCMSV